MGETLAWGNRYLAVEPTHFRVDYQINPFMDLANQPDAQLARLQWDAMLAAMTGHGASVETLPQRADAPDMVYAMNLGLAFTDAVGASRAVLSHMRFPQRRMETSSAEQWFLAEGMLTSYVGRDGVGAHFEAGDAFPFGDALLVGYGPRTDELGLKHLAKGLDTRVRGFRITHPGMYHLDLAFCPLTSTRAIVCPSAFDEESAAALLALIPEPLIITEAEALETFCANSIVIGSTVIMPACPDRVRDQLEEWGLTVVLLDLSEFHKGGGSIRCLTNPLDLQVGRDLPHVPGGEVLLPTC